MISLVIITRWASIMSEQVKKIVGHTAPPDFIFKVRAFILFRIDFTLFYFIYNSIFIPFVDKKMKNSAADYCSGENKEPLPILLLDFF